MFGYATDLRSLTQVSFLLHSILLGLLKRCCRSHSSVAPSVGQAIDPRGARSSIHPLICSATLWSVHPFVLSFIYFSPDVVFSDSFIRSFIRLSVWPFLRRLFMHSYWHSYLRSFVRSFFHGRSCEVYSSLSIPSIVLPFVYSFVCSSIHSSVHVFSHWFDQASFRHRVKGSFPWSTAGTRLPLNRCRRSWRTGSVWTDSRRPSPNNSHQHTSARDQHSPFTRSHSAVGRVEAFRERQPVRSVVIGWEAPSRAKDIKVLLLLRSRSTDQCGVWSQKLRSLFLGFSFASCS